VISPVFMRITRFLCYFYYKKNKAPKSNTCSLPNNYILTKLKKYIMAKDPKLIISTFPVVSQYLSDIKKNHGLSVPFITCITDVVDGWEWITPNCDKYFVATKDVKKTMLKMGIKSEKVIVTGIPLREEFLGSLKPLLSFSLPEGGTIVVIMGGGMGLIPKEKNFYHWLNNLEKVTTLVLTGHNKKIFNFISKLNLENIIPLGYTNEVATIMAKADLLITKAGGITVFEAIASKLPVILHQPKLGQEIENAKFIHKKSIGKITFNIEDLQYTITGLLNNKDRLMKYRTKIAKLSHDINMRVLAEESIKLLNCL